MSIVKKIFKFIGKALCVIALIPIGLLLILSYVLFRILFIPALFCFVAIFGATQTDDYIIRVVSLDDEAVPHCGTIVPDKRKLH